MNWKEQLKCEHSDGFEGISSTLGDIEAFIEELLEAKRKEMIKQLKNKEICTNCGRSKKNKLSDWCCFCLEEE